MVLTNDLSHPALHQWLKYQDTDQFHAYAELARGTVPVCKGYRPIGDLEQMDLPSDRSRCCNECSRALFGYPPPLTEEQAT